MQAAEALVLAAIIASLFWLLTPVRNRLERWFTSLLRPKRERRPGRVVVLAKRNDGTFTGEGGNER